MIITRSPLRICLGGGGTDLPSYYEKKDGFVISAAIDKYVYVTINEPFSPGYYLKYSKMETVDDIEEIEHPIIREVLRRNWPEKIEMTTLADVPAGTGLGSSGSFTTALIKAMSIYNNGNIHPYALAEEACDIEINVLKESVGKQDQYISALGGITYFDFFKSGSVNAWQAKISKETLIDLESNLLLFFTGIFHKASDVLEEQNEKSKNSDPETLEHLDYIKEMGVDIKNNLESGDTYMFARNMDKHWVYKKKLSKMITDPKIDLLYEYGMNAGALGGKLVGAGGGGFLLFYTEDPKKLRLAMSGKGLQELRFKFDFEGTKVVLA